MLGYIPVQFFFLAKSELFKIPFMGWHLERAGHVSVPIEDPKASLRTLAQAAKLVTERNVSVLFFPEGGRSESGELQEFKDGAAYIAIKAQVPLVPVALVGIRDILPMHTLDFKRGVVKLRFGKPIPTVGLTTQARQEITVAARMGGVGVGGARAAATRTRDRDGEVDDRRGDGRRLPRRPGRRDPRRHPARRGHRAGDVGGDGAASGLGGVTARGGTSRRPTSRRCGCARRAARRTWRIYT